MYSNCTLRDCHDVPARSLSSTERQTMLTNLQLKKWSALLNFAWHFVGSWTCSGLESHLVCVWKWLLTLYPPVMPFYDGSIQHSQYVNIWINISISGLTILVLLVLQVPNSWWILGGFFRQTHRFRWHLGGRTQDTKGYKWGTMVYNSNNYDICGTYKYL